MNPDAVPISAWSSYLSVQAGAAATLTGLVFVAVSINLSRILSVTGLTGRAAESLLQLFGVLVIATTALIPRQPPVALGTEFLVMGAALWITQTVLQIQYMMSRTGHPRYWVITRIIQTQFANIPFLISGILLLGGWPAALYWLAAGLVFSLIAGVASAWVLLVEILR
jgi:hypothetical protein